MLSNNAFMTPIYQWTFDHSPINVLGPNWIIEQIQMALYLSVKLYEVTRQPTQQEVNHLQSIIQQDKDNDGKSKRKLSETTQIIDKMHQKMIEIQMEKNESIQNLNQIKGVNLQFNSYFNQNQKNQKDNIYISQHQFIIANNHKKVPRTASSNQSKFIKKVQKLKTKNISHFKLKIVNLLKTAEITSKITRLQMKQIRTNLMQRIVRTWNPPKEEQYIKNRQFRMLLRKV